MKWLRKNFPAENPSSPASGPLGDSEGHQVWRSSSLGGGQVSIALTQGHSAAGTKLTYKATKPKMGHIYSRVTLALTTNNLRKRNNS